jgi:hypothetical protein
MSTLKKHRDEIILTINGGVQKEDDKRRPAYWDQLIFDARAEVIPEWFSSKGFDETWLQTQNITVTRTQETNGMYYYEGTRLPISIPLHTNKDSDLGYYRVSGLSKVPGRMQQFEKIKTSQASRAHTFLKNRPNHTLVYFIGTVPYFISKNNNLKNVAVDLVAFDPKTVTGFTENSPFPCTPQLFNMIKQRIFAMDLRILKSPEDTNNDSVQKANQTGNQQEEQA